jgi:VWFA-related protein
MGLNPPSACIGLLLAVVGAVSASPQQPPAFKARADAVNVDVLVTRDGVPVRGLTAENFEVRDNGVVQLVDSVSSEPVQLDVAVVLGPVDRPTPRAGVRTHTTFPAQSAAGDALRAAFAAQDHVQIVPFTSAIRIAESTGRDPVDLREWLETKARRSGSRPMRDAVFLALASRHDHPGRFVVVVLTDGVDIRSWSRGDQVVEVARRWDALVYVLKARRDWPGNLRYVKEDFLDDIADVTGGRVISAERDELREYLARLLDECRSRYLLTYQPKTLGRGWHTLEVILRGATGRVVARRGYWVE